MLRLALASDTVSIAIMEVVDNAIMLAVPGAMDAHLDQPLFWAASRRRWSSPARRPSR